MLLKLGIGAVVFILLSCLKAGAWDALGMGFMNIRFRVFHLYLIPIMALRDILRGRGRDLNWRFAGICTALFVGILAISCGAGWLAGTLIAG